MQGEGGAVHTVGAQINFGDLTPYLTYGIFPPPTQFMDGEYSLATATLADIMPELQEKIQVQPNQCCGSDSESGSKVLMTKNWRMKQSWIFLKFFK